jgi:hypothetical protein
VAATRELPPRRCHRCQQPSPLVCQGNSSPWLGDGYRGHPVKDTLPSQPRFLIGIDDRRVAMPTHRAVEYRASRPVLTSRVGDRRRRPVHGSWDGRLGYNLDTSRSGPRETVNHRSERPYLICRVGNFGPSIFDPRAVNTYRIITLPDLIRATDGGSNGQDFCVTLWPWLSFKRAPILWYIQPAVR